MPQPYTFATKAVFGAGLVLLADRMLFGRPWGWVAGAFCLAWLTSCAIANPALRRGLWRWAALLAAAALALLQVEAPSVLGFVLFWLLLTGAVLAPRAERFGDVRRWLGQVALHGLISIAGPVIDLVKAHRLRRRLGRISWLKTLPKIVLPLLGALVFLALFAIANPVIGAWLARIVGPDLTIELVSRLVFAGMVGVAVWATLRPRWARVRRVADGRTSPLPVPTLGPVVLSLVLFNAVFALQNALDIAFLWSGARLPDGLSYAEYAHRGVYSLIVAAALAALFVLVAMRPGTDTARRPLVRGLVVTWVGQSVFLMASSALRLVRYIEAYSLTQMRIGAFLVIALVAVGLALVCWRLLRDKSQAWLVNANALALAGVLTGLAVIDTGAVAAGWNVRHAREAGGGGMSLDLCYMNRLGVSGLVPLSEFQARPLDPDLRDRVAWVRARALRNLEYRQTQFGGWTWRGQRRLSEAYRLAGGAPPIREDSRGCDGRFVTATATYAPPLPAPSPAKPSEPIR